MNDHETPDQGTNMSLVPASGDGHDLLPASLITGVDQFENPGLPPHVHRAADDDPAAAKRAERQVATMFGLSMLGTLVFIVSYFAVPDEATFFFPGIGIAKTQNVVLGLSLGFAIFFIGIGAVHWAKTLMSDEEVVEERHEQASTPEERAKAVAVVNAGVASTQLPRRPLIKYSLGGALGLFALPLGLQVAGSLGPVNVEELKRTIWDPKENGGKPIRLMRDPEMTPIRFDEVTNGSVFHVMPETLQKYIDEGKHVLEAKAKAAVIMIRLDPDLIKVQKANGLGRRRHRRLLQDLHPRRLPGRPVRAADAPPALPLPPVDLRPHRGLQGHLRPGQARRCRSCRSPSTTRATSSPPRDFAEPVGPSFWERAR